MTDIQYQLSSGFSGFTAQAIADLVSRKIIRRSAPPLESVAEESWEIAPMEERDAPAAFFLPGQMERISGWTFATEHPRSAMHGGKVIHGATRGYLLKNVWLIDGTLYKDGASRWLLPRGRKLPTMRVQHEVARGALFATAMGNKYFGQWLMDDCVTYALAWNEGTPVTTNQPVNLHTHGYEDWLDMHPVRMNNVFFHELVVFDDNGQNQSKHRRFRAMSDKLLSHVHQLSHPGVFILRGKTGELRLLQNELELAEYLYVKRGFRILDPSKVDVSTIVATCAGARTVVGVEGSGLMHGILALQPGGSVLTLQPPDRFVRVYKDLTDRDRQHFGFVVGNPEAEGFRIDPIEVERTLDLFPQ